MGQVQIYDIYVLKTSGVPLFAGCTATDYCKSHMGQHELISGFLSAMWSFSQESFEDNELERMEYSEVQLNFQVDQSQDLMMVFIHDKESDKNIIKEHLDTAFHYFLGKYGKEASKQFVDQKIFSDFKQDLRKLKIIPEEGTLLDTSRTQTPNEKHKTSKPGLFNWVRSIFG